MLITRPRTPSFAEHVELEAQDPVIHTLHVLEESIGDYGRELALQEKLAAPSEEHRQIEKRWVEKSGLLLTKMVGEGKEMDWDGLVVKMRERHPDSAASLEKLVTRAHALGLLE